MFILCMILHFTKNNTINCSVVMIQLLLINRCLILIKCCIYLKQWPHFYNLNKIQSVQRMHFFWRFCLITLSHRFPTNTLYSYILIGEKSCQTVTTRVPISKGKIQLFSLHRNIKTNNRTDKVFKIVLQAIHFQWIVDQILGNPIADI